MPARTRPRTSTSGGDTPSPSTADDAAIWAGAVLLLAALVAFVVTAAVVGARELAESGPLPESEI